MIEAVIFDLYGTLIQVDYETNPYLRFARLACPKDPRSILRQSLLLNANGLGELARHLNITPPSSLQLLEYDLEREIQSTRLFDDVLETLAQLAARGLKLGLISNLATPYKEPFHQLGLAPYFQATLFSCDAGFRKPDAELFLRMTQALGVSPANALMVGDNPRSDVAGARSAGLAAILLQRDAEPPISGTIGSLRDLCETIRLDEEVNSLKMPSSQ